MQAEADMSGHQNPLLNAALDYAQRGWPVFPCRRQGKEPLTPHGFKDATRDPERIAAWWRQWPDANVAIATGARSGLVVLDIDPRNGGDVNLALLEDEHGALPETAESLTGGGGRHVFFTYPESDTIKSNSGLLGSGIDVKADGGYIIAPPSIHLSGNHYEWEVTHGPENVPLAALPGWVTALLKSNGVRIHSNVEEEPIREGQRNTTLFKLACSLRTKGLSAEAILAALQAENRARCQLPLSEDEVQKIVQSASQYTPAPSPRHETTAAQPFPSGLTLTKLADLFKEPEEQVPWLVDNLLPIGGFSLLVAKPKVGKSTLARNLALTVARGEMFLNRPTRQGAVIYLALEEKRSEVKKHFQDMGATGEEDISIHAASAPADALRQIRAIADETRPVLIIIDPLFRFTRVKDGNDYVQVAQALEPLLVLARETGAHVLAVHHAGKGEREGGDSILGSTAIFAAVDTALIMKRSERYRTISSQQRYGEDMPETVLRFDAATRTISLGETKEQEEGKRIEAAILVVLKLQEEDQDKGHALTQAELDEEVEGKTTYKRKALKALVDGNQLERLGKGGKSDPFRYCLKDSRFVVPPYSKEHGNKNQESKRTQQEDLPFSCSRDFGLTPNVGKSREHESCPFCRRESCVLTPGGWWCRLSAEDRKRWTAKQTTHEKQFVWEEEL